MKERIKPFKTLLTVLGESEVVDLKQCTKQWYMPYMVYNGNDMLAQIVFDDSSGICQINVDPSIHSEVQEHLSPWWQDKFWYDVPIDQREDDQGTCDQLLCLGSESFQSQVHHC